MSVHKGRGIYGIVQFFSMNSASTSVVLKISYLHQLSCKLELTYVLFPGNKKAPEYPRIGAIHQFSNNDVEDDIAKTNVEPL